MNEEAIQQGYSIFKSEGYNGSIDDYKQLISTNGNALKQTYDIFKQEGYNEDINSFKTLMGIGSIKKKSQAENGGSTLGVGSSASPKTERKSKESYVPVGGLPMGGGMFINPSGKGQDFAIPEDLKNSSDEIKKRDYSKYKKVGNSYYDGEGEIFNNYPGKEGKPYRFNDNQWYEYSSSLLGDKGDIHELNNPIKDPRRVLALNKQFNKTAGTEKGVFIGYPGKEQNEYKINNDGTWQRRTPENKTWVTVTNENSISALNNQFGQSAKKIEPEKISKIKEDNLYQSNFYANLKSINAQLIGGEEEEAVDVLRRKFPLFTFNEINAGDKIEITSPKGNKEQFTLDNWTWDKDKKISEEMIGWMEGNNLSPSEKKQYANVRRANAEEASFKYPNIGDTAAMKAMQEDMSLNLKKAINPNDVTAPSLESTQYALEKEKANKKAKELRADWMPIKSQKLNDIVNKYSEYTSYKGNVSEYEKTRAQAALGALASDKVEIGNVNKYQDDIKYNIDSYKSKLNDTSFFNNLQNKYDNGEITEDQYNLDYTNRQKELIDQEKEIKNQIKISDALIKNVNKSVGENYLIQETKGSIGGGLVLGAIKGVLSPVRLLAGSTGRDMSAAEYHEAVKEAISPLWDFDTSLEYLRSEERSDLTKAAFSVAESLGAMAPMALSGGATLLGTGLLARGAMTATAFYPMSYYEMKDELEEIDIPESDKVAMASIYGVVSSALESIGMEYALGKIDTAIGSSIKRNILKRVLGKSLSKDAPKEAIDALVRNETKSYIASLGLGTLGAMSVEGVTESLQSLTGAGIKEIYDTAKETEFFSNEGFGDIVKGALYEGYLGALGGGMVHSIYIAKDAYKRNNVLKSKELNNLLMAAKTSGMSEALMSNLKSDMLSNRITKEQAEEISNNFEIVRGMMNQMPENLTVEGQSASLSLLLEKNELNKQIEGKDPNLVKRQAARVNEINERLQEIGEKNTVENAIQEQTAGQVSVQPTTTVGEEVVQGEPTAEPQVLTEEGKAEEVAPLTIQEELQLLAEEQAEAPKAPVVEAPTLEAPVIEAPIVEAPTLETPVVEVEATPQEKVATYRAEEQAELLKAIPKIESYKVKGKIDKTKMPKTVLAKYNKIYEKYDALISPLLEPVVETPVVKAEATKTKGELPVMSWSKVEEYDDAVIRSMKEIQYGKLKPLLDLGKRTTVAQKEEIRTIEAKIATAERILDRRANKIKKEAQRVEKEGKGATVRAVDNNGTEAEYSVVVSKDGATAKVQLKKIGTLTPKRASVEANLTIETDEKRGRFVITKNKTKVYIDEAITPAKVEPTKAKVTSKAKVEVKPVVEEVKAEPVKEEVKVEAPVVEEVVEVEQYQPITIEKIFNDRFSKENAISYDEEERETDNGRMSTYISSITMDVTNEDGDSIGTLTKLVDEDRIITWNGEDFDGNQLSEQDFDFKDDARQAIVDKWNKEQKKNFDREAKKKIKDAQKAKEKADKAAAKEEAKSASVVKKEEAPAPAKESTDDLMGAINSIKEDIEDTTKEIEDARKVAREKINKIREEILDLKKSKGKEGTIMDLEADIKEIEDILKEDLDGLKLDLDRHVQALKEEVKKIEDLDAKNPENKKTLLSYLDAAIKTLNGLNKLSYVKLDLGVTVGTLKLILKGIRAGVIAGNTINASIKKMASEYRGKHKNKKITIAEFTKEIEEYLRNTFVDQKTNEQDIQEARDKFVEIREAVRKAKVAVKTESKALRANAENAIREMLKGKVKNLTAVQMKSIMLRLARFNVFSQTQYDKFIDYVDKVIGIADYDAKVTKANENRKTAKKNLPKLGDISSDLLEPLSRVLNINAKLIPSDVFESYSEIIDMLSKRDAILELNKRADLNESLDKIIESIELNEQRVSDLKELYDNFSDKVVKNGVINYTETLDKMLEDGVIDKTEHELMKTFKSKIQGAKVKEKMTEQEIADEKAELIDEINNTTITLDEIVGDEFRLERDLVKKLQVLLKNKESLESLNNKDLKDLLRIIDNINNGFVSNATQQMVERLNFIEKSVSLEASIPKTVASIFKKIRQYITDLTSRDKFGVNIAPLFNIDEQFGDFKTKTIFNAVFEQSAVAQQIYQSEITDIQGELTQVEKAISNIFKNNGNKVVLSKFKMMVYMMQLEYNSNPNNNQVHQAMKTLDETIKFAKQNSKKSGYKAADIKQMEFIKEQFAKDGEIDIDKLYNSFNEAEKNALKKLQDINNRMTKKATYTASVINGKKIKPIKNYVFYNTISASDRLSTAELINNMSNNMNPTTTSKNLEERDGKVHPVNLNAFFAVNQSARSVLINYHMTEPIRTARKTLSKAKQLLEDNNATTDQYEILNTIGEAYDTATRDLLQSNFTQSNEVMNWLQKTGYRSMLASAPRAISELMSNVSFVMINNPRDMAVGMNEYWALSTSEDAKDILTILGSKVTSRNYPSDKLSSGLVDLSAVTSKLSKNRNIRSREVNGVFQLYDNTLGKWVNGVEFVADNLISQPDKIVMKPLWFGAFARSFQKETGVAPDFDKIKANNEEYMDKYRDALVKAKNNADTQTISAGSSTNAYMGILQNVVREGDSSTKQIAKNFNKFMNKFTVQEYYTARKGVNALVGNGDIPWEQGAQILAAVTARMTLYVTATRLLSELMLSAFGYGNDDEDDEDKKTMLQRLYQGVVSSATTLLIGRSFGNIIRVIENSLIEKANEEYGEKIGLRNGEYDPYEDAVQFNQLQKGKIDEPTDLVKIIAGPYAPLIGVGELGFKLLEPEPKTERAKLTRAKEWYRAGMETLGLLGAVPFYRDIKKVALAEVYKELKKETKETAVKKEAKAKTDAEEISQQISILKQMMNSGAYTREGIKKELRKIKDPEYRKAEKKIEDDMLKSILDKTKYSSRTDFEKREKENAKNAFKMYDKKREESLKINRELKNRMDALEYGEQYVPKKKKSSGTFGGGDSFGGSSSFGGSDSFGGGDSFGESDSFGGGN